MLDEWHFMGVQLLDQVAVKYKTHYEQMYVCRRLVYLNQGKGLLQANCEIIYYKSSDVSPVKVSTVSTII